MKKVIWYTGTEKNTAVQAIESGATINACNIVIFAKQKEAEAYAAKRDGKKDSHRKLWQAVLPPQRNSDIYIL